MQVQEVQSLQGEGEELHCVICLNLGSVGCDHSNTRRMAKSFGDERWWERSPGRGDETLNHGSLFEQPRCGHKLHEKCLAPQAFKFTPPKPLKRELTQNG